MSNMFLWRNKKKKINCLVEKKKKTTIKNALSEATTILSSRWTTYLAECEGSEVKADHMGLILPV